MHKIKKTLHLLPSSMLTKTNSSWVSCYKFFKSALPHITPYENNFLLSDLARKRQPNWQYIFLGAIGDTKSRKLWDWVDGNPFKAFHNWDTQMPRGNRRQAVLAMNRSGRWINAYADRTLPGRTVVVCKFSTN